jgi:chemotaxis protein methyltransferase CheR
MSGFEPECLGLAETGLPLLRDLIHKRTGLFYDNGRCQLLAERVAPLVLDRGFQSFLDFYYLLKYDEQAEGQWQSVMDALSVQETYFWREIDQIHALAERIMPILAREYEEKTIQIWSAPCATGEEPLTIAMVLNEGGWFDRLPIEIHASDGSSRAIAMARAGCYRERSFRVLPEAMREKYFGRSEHANIPRPALRNRITTWSVVNLMDRAAVAPFASSHVVFCRNAFIYFSLESVTRVVAELAERMPSPGYLFVGAAESLLRATDRFALQQIDNAFVYVK